MLKQKMIKNCFLAVALLIFTLSVTTPLYYAEGKYAWETEEGLRQTGKDFFSRLNIGDDGKVNIFGINVFKDGTDGFGSYREISKGLLEFFTKSPLSAAYRGPTEEIYEERAARATRENGGNKPWNIAASDYMQDILDGERENFRIYGIPDRDKLLNPKTATGELKKFFEDGVLVTNLPSKVLEETKDDIKRWQEQQEEGWRQNNFWEEFEQGLSNDVEERINKGIEERSSKTGEEFIQGERAKDSIGDEIRSWERASEIEGDEEESKEEKEQRESWETYEDFWKDYEKVEPKADEMKYWSDDDWNDYDSYGTPPSLNDHMDGNGTVGAPYTDLSDKAKAAMFEYDENKQELILKDDWEKALQEKIGYYIGQEWNVLLPQDKKEILEALEKEGKITNEQKEKALKNLDNIKIMVPEDVKTRDEYNKVSVNGEKREAEKNEVLVTRKKEKEEAPF